MGRILLEQSEKLSERKTMITIDCKDGSKRVINCLGTYNNNTAAILAKDLEGDNYKSVQTKIL